MVLFVWIALSIGIGAIARNKGRSGMGFFLLALIFSPFVGLIAVLLAKPNRQAVEAAYIQDGRMKKCPYCAELVKAEAVVCRYCKKDIGTTATIDV